MSIQIITLYVFNIISFYNSLEGELLKIDHYNSAKNINEIPDFDWETPLFLLLDFSLWKTFLRRILAFFSYMINESVVGVHYLITSIFTLIIPEFKSPILLKAERVRSIIRPFTNGPLSLTFTTTLFLFLMFVT